MPAIVIIPARYKSTRFPGKPLYPISGKAMILHVYERVLKAKGIQGVFVATDNKKIYDTVIRFGGKAIMTSGGHQSGTDRIAEASEKLSSEGINHDIVVNVQGDEPMIMPEMVEEVVLLMQDRRASISTLARRINEPSEVTDPNVVKVVFDREGFALYFSRSPIPYHRDEWKDPRQIKVLSSQSTVFKHIGIYAYRKEALLNFSRLGPSRLEEIEKLEQLRALENGMRIKVGETGIETIGVDTKEDAERVEKWLSIYS